MTVSPAGVNFTGGGTGSDGDDVFTGQDSAEVFYGNAGDDVIIGNGGDDILVGGAGTNLLEGGAGGDVFLISNAGLDFIKDFTGGTDRLRIETTDPKAVLNLTQLKALGYEWDQVHSDSSAAPGTPANDSGILDTRIFLDNDDNGSFSTGDEVVTVLLDYTGALTFADFGVTAPGVVHTSSATDDLTVTARVGETVTFGSLFASGTELFSDPDGEGFGGIQLVGPGITIGGATLPPPYLSRGFHIGQQPGFPVSPERAPRNISAVATFRVYAGDNSDPGDLSETIYTTTINSIGLQITGSGTGSAGDDLFLPARQSGEQTFTGGAGTDVISYAGYPEGKITVHMQDGWLASSYNSTSTVHRFSSIEDIIGTQNNDTFNAAVAGSLFHGAGGDDTFHGNTSADTFHGEGGYDTLLGNAGNDTLDGGDGNDTVNGGTGNDTLIGGRGNDLLIGADGDDIYVLSSEPGTGIDFVRENSGGTDKIQIDVDDPSTITTLTDIRSLGYEWDQSNARYGYETVNAGYPPDDPDTINTRIFFDNNNDGVFTQGTDSMLMVLFDHTATLTFADFDIV